MVDPSAFYRINEELARELSRLESEGHLRRLQELLAGADAELLVASVRPREGLEELLGVLRPAAEDEGAEAPLAAPPAPAAEPAAEAGGGCGDGGCGCGPTDPAAVAALGPARRRGGWDHEGVLAARSRFQVTLPGGTPREVYMPDHVCPACFNDERNHIDACARVCARCAFEW